MYPSAGIDLDEARRKREDNIVQLRKDKRDENLQKKRMTSGLMMQNAAEEQQKTPSSVQQRLAHLPEMVRGVMSENTEQQLEATTQFRKLLSIERSPPIDEVINQNVIPRFVQLLGRDDIPTLQF